MNINIIKITILRSHHGADELILTTELPNGCYPYDGCSHLKMTIAKDSAEKYIENNFNGVNFELIEV